MKNRYELIENYIYLYHTDTWIILPTYPTNIADSISARFSSTTPLSRTAPIYSYSYSGPRQIQFQFELHRDYFEEINTNNSSLINVPNEELVDTMVRDIQSMALPVYDATQKMVNPPMVAVRIGNQVFIKGVIESTVGVDYGLPILENGKYADIKINFSVSEIEPFDALDVQRDGSMRGLSTTLERRLWRLGQ